MYFYSHNDFVICFFYKKDGGVFLFFTYFYFLDIFLDNFPKDNQNMKNKTER